MRRTFAVAVVAVASLFAYTGVAVAQDPAPDQELPPAFAPPVIAPVVDVAGAEAFAENYADRNAARFLRTDRRRVRVLDANAACLEHPVVQYRFGCVFTLRALTFERSRGHWSRASKARGDDPRKHRRPRIRVRTFGCLGLLSVQGGPAVTPSGILRAIDCVRVRNGDYTAPEPVA